MNVNYHQLFFCFITSKLVSCVIFFLCCHSYGVDLFSELLSSIFIKYTCLYQEHRQNDWIDTINFNLVQTLPTKVEATNWLDQNKFIAKRKFGTINFFDRIGIWTWVSWHLSYFTDAFSRSATIDWLQLCNVILDFGYF